MKTLLAAFVLALTLSSCSVTVKGLDDCEKKCCSKKACETQCKETEHDV